MSKQYIPLVTEEENAFSKLPVERQEAIANAAIEVFGCNTYKDASTETIAKKAGISKGLLFFYCKNKKQLYLNTMDYLYEKVIDTVVDDHFWEIDDFFELLIYSARSKSALFERFPWALSFCIHAYYPDHRDIKDTMNHWIQKQIDCLFPTFLKNINWNKFRDDIDPKQVINMLIWIADGWMHQQQAAKKAITLDELLSEFYTWIDMLRGWSYKPEYLVPSKTEPGGLQAQSNTGE